MTHLSPEQISDWIIGERVPEHEQHLAICDKCLDDIARLEEGLAHFRLGMREWAVESGESVAWGETEQVRTRFSWAWAAVPVLVLGIILVPLYRDAQRAEHEAQTAEDALLLDQVQLRITRTVPQSMEHLMQLMTEEPGGLK